MMYHSDQYGGGGLPQAGYNVANAQNQRFNGPQAHMGNMMDQQTPAPCAPSLARD